MMVPLSGDRGPNSIRMRGKKTTLHINSCLFIGFIYFVLIIMLRLTSTRNLVKSRHCPLLIKKQLYHDDGVYGYRVAKEYKLPDYTSQELANRMKHGSLLRMVQAYRTHGHEGAHLDPLDIMKRK